MLEKVRQHPAVWLILLLGLLPLTWFRGSELITSLDLDFPLSGQYTLQRSLFIWDHLENGLGWINSRTIATTLPYGLFLAAAERLGLSPGTAERILFYLWFAGAGLSMYVAATILLPRQPARHLGALTAALLYMLNPIALIFIWPQLVISIFSYAFLPLKLGLFAFGLRQRQGFRFIFWATLLWLVTSTSTYTNPALALVDWAPLFLYALFFILTNDGRVAAVRYVALSFGFWLLLNSFWLLPVALSLQDEYANAALEVVGATDLESIELSSTSLAGSFRLGGFWAIRGGYLGDAYYPWSAVYDSPHFLLAGYLLPVLAFAALLRPSRTTNGQPAIAPLYFATLALLALWLIKGVLPPLAQLNLYQLLPGSLLERAFRAPYHKFGLYLALSYAWLIGFTLQSAVHWLQQQRPLSSPILPRLVVIPVLLLLGGFYVWPMWSGDVIYAGGQLLPSGRTTIPADYEQAAEWLTGQNEPDYRILALPLSRLRYGAYRWPAGYFGAAPDGWLLPRPVITSGYGLNGEVAKYLATPGVEGIGTLLQWLNVRYLLVHEDANWPLIQTHPWWISSRPETMLAALEGQNLLTPAARFGNLHLYENEQWRPRQLYASERVWHIEGGLPALLALAEQPTFDLRDKAVTLAGATALPAVEGVVQVDDGWPAVEGPSPPAGTTVRLVHHPPSAAARSYEGWQTVLTGDPSQTAGTLPVSGNSPYHFPPQSPGGWNALNSTLVYLTAGSQPLRLDQVRADGLPLTNFNVWWESGWMGMGTQSMDYPVLIPAGERAIIQIDRRDTQQIELVWGQKVWPLPVEDGRQQPFTWAELGESGGREQGPSSHLLLPDDPLPPAARSNLRLSYARQNPTRYTVWVEGVTGPHALILSESFHPGWQITLEGQPAGAAPIHFEANGYANGWWLEVSDDYQATISFRPQRYAYGGAAVSALSIVAGIIVLVWCQSGTTFLGRNLVPIRLEDENAPGSQPNGQ